MIPRMIKHARQCAICQRVATRTVPDRPQPYGSGGTLRLCDQCPSPQQIDAAAHAIAWSWTDTERGTRYWRCTSEQVEGKTAIFLDDPAAICRFGWLE